jgi:hypothetical protein
MKSYHSAGFFAVISDTHYKTITWDQNGPLRTRSSGMGNAFGILPAQIHKIRPISGVAGKERRDSGRIAAYAERIPEPYGHSSESGGHLAVQSDYRRNTIHQPFETSWRPRVSRCSCKRRSRAERSPDLGAPSPEPDSCPCKVLSVGGPYSSTSCCHPEKR